MTVFYLFVSLCRDLILRLDLFSVSWYLLDMISLLLLSACCLILLLRDLPIAYSKRLFLLFLTYVVAWIVTERSESF